MRIPSHHIRSDPGDSSTAMTPMIDVVFLLLIFFVVASAGVIKESVLATELASLGSVAAAIELPPSEPWELEIRLTLARDDRGRTTVDMNGMVYESLDLLEEQLQALAAIDPANPVILDVGPGVEWGSVIDLYDRCRRTGLETVNFAIDADDVQPSA